MIFEDNVVLLDENTNVLKGKLERQRQVQEKIGLKISMFKTEFLEFMFENKVERNANVRIII